MTVVDRWDAALSLCQIWALSLQHFPRKSTLKSWIQHSRYDRCQTKRPKDSKHAGCVEFTNQRLARFWIAMGCREKLLHWLVDRDVIWICNFQSFTHDPHIFVRVKSTIINHEHMVWSACGLILESSQYLTPSTQLIKIRITCK